MVLTNIVPEDDALANIMEDMLYGGRQDTWIGCEIQDLVVCVHQLANSIL